MQRGRLRAPEEIRNERIDIISLPIVTEHFFEFLNFSEILGKVQRVPEGFAKYSILKLPLFHMGVFLTEVTFNSGHCIIS